MGTDKSFFLAFVFPVILTFVVGKNQIDGSSILGKFIGPCEMLFLWVSNAVDDFFFGLGLIEPGKQNNKTCHVVR